jgi:DnaJ-domain-containing protein 1
MSIIGRLYKIARAGLPLRRTGRRINQEQVEAGWSGTRMKEPLNQNPAKHLDPEFVSYYANLEIPYGADLATARKAWRSLLKKYHPDLHSNDLEKRRIAHELTQGLNRAFEELEKRLT